MVVLAGPGSSLSVACPWRLMRACRLETSYGDDGASAALDGLVGHQVIDFRRGDGSRSPGDIQIALDDGAVLDVFADTDLDPWVLRLPDQTFVGNSVVRVARLVRLQVLVIGLLGTLGSLAADASWAEERTSARSARQGWCQRAS